MHTFQGFQAEYNRACNRIAQGFAYRVFEAAKLPGAIVKQGVFREGGNECIAVYDSNGRFLASALLSDCSPELIAKACN